MRLPRSARYREIPEGLTPIPITIVGRANVGKSTLFNCLQSSTKKKYVPIARKAIISDRAGTTRDRKDAVAVFGGLLLRVIDTGGLENAEATEQSTLLTSMREHVWRAVAEAEAILFVIDAREGVTPVDLYIASLLRNCAANREYYRQFLSGNPKNTDTPIILVANKAEGAFIGPYLNDCYELGVGDPVVISARQKEGMEDLYDRLCLEVGHLQGGEEEEGEEFESDDDMGDDHATRVQDDGWEEDEEDEEEYVEEEDQMEEGRGEEHDADHEFHEEDTPPVPNLKWMPPNPLTEDQKRALRWFAIHPADPLGDYGDLKASVLHRDESDVQNFWLAKHQKLLPDKETRDFVLKFRRLEQAERPVRLAVIGEPSTGKSSLINSLLQEERCVVDEADGTTMDTTVTDWTFKDRQFKLIDTCGVLRGWQYPGMYGDLIEAGMGTRKAIRKSHVVILCVDAERGRNKTYWTVPKKWELRLAKWASEEGKPVVLAVNKWDLIGEEDQVAKREQVLRRVADGLSDIKGMPVVFTSARYNLNLAMLATRCLAIHKRWSARLPTGKLNDWLQSWMTRYPAPWKDGQKCSVKYMTQTRTRPPTFIVWTNTAFNGMPRNYIRQLQNAMREEFRISGVPIRMIQRSTLMPKPRKKLSKKEILKWKRVGPKQAEVVSNLNSKKMVRKKPKQE